MRKSWRHATLDAIRRHCRRTGRQEFRFADLCTEEIQAMLRETGRNPDDPRRSLSEQVQILAAMNRAANRVPELRRIGRGRYQLIGPTWDLCDTTN